MKISLEILRKINQNDLAIKLERDTLGKVLTIKKTAFNQKEELKSNRESLKESRKRLKHGGPH